MPYKNRATFYAAAMKGRVETPKKRISYMEAITGELFSESEKTEIIQHFVTHGGTGFLHNGRHATTKGNYLIVTK